LNWWVGRAALGIRIVTSFTGFLLADPALIKERSPIRPGIKSWDMVLTSISFLFVYRFILAVAGLDYRIHLQA
jgi:hypothetical protein